MQRKLIAFIFVFFIAVAIPATAYAQGLAGSSADERLQNAVSQQKLELAESDKAIVGGKCEMAQKQLIATKLKTEKVIRLRVDTYSTIQKELQAIKLRMARQGIDASEIDLLIGKIQQRLDQLTIAADDYGGALNDIISISCGQKPEQFMAGLVVARAKQAIVLEKARALHNTTNDPEADTFDQLKRRLTV